MARIAPAYADEKDREPVAAGHATETSACSPRTRPNHTRRQPANGVRRTTRQTDNDQAQAPANDERALTSDGANDRHPNEQRE